MLAKSQDLLKRYRKLQAEAKNFNAVERQKMQLQKQIEGGDSELRKTLEEKDSELKRIRTAASQMRHKCEKAISIWKERNEGLQKGNH